MNKLLYFQCALLLFLIQGTVVGMHNTKVLGKTTIKRYRQFYKTPVENNYHMFDLIREFNSPDAPMHKLAQAHIELRRIEIETQIHASLSTVPLEIREDWLERLRKINIKE